MHLDTIAHSPGLKTDQTSCFVNSSAIRPAVLELTMLRYRTVALMGLCARRTVLGGTLVSAACISFAQVRVVLCENSAADKVRSSFVLAT